MVLIWKGFPPTGVNSDLYNPFALRKAKIVYNFGLSECNRVKNVSFLRLRRLKTIMARLFPLTCIPTP